MARKPQITVKSIYVEVRMRVFDRDGQGHLFGRQPLDITWRHIQ